MTTTIEALIAFVATYPDLAYATIFCAALLEAVPVLGSFVPGSTIILGLSAVVATGGLKLPAVLASAILGAAIGDGTAFWIGHRTKRRVLQSWPLSNYPGVIARSEIFFQQHGALAVFFARFLPPVRAFVPVTAGALDMAPRRFFSINIVAIAMWATLHILPGALAGSLLLQWGNTLHHHLALVGLAALAIGTMAWTIRQLLQRRAKK
jgi:membrane protein DedA with SNARE-associated domain